MDLLERETELSVLREAFASAAGGEGRAVAVSGESGAGKSALVSEALAVSARVRVMRGQCDPLGTPRPLGPLRDLGLPGLDDLVRSDVRLSDIGEHAYAALTAEPTIVVIEDIHWVDEASAEVLRFLARRVQAAPLVLVVTYRDTEIGPRHTARPLLGDVAVLDGFASIALAPLSVEGVARLVADTGLDPERVHALTGGNAFFVTQVAKEPGRPLPTSVRDAVLARTTEVGPDDLEVLQLISCAPDRLDDRLLPRVGVDLPTLRRLDQTALLDRDEHGLVFRHELARLAIESTIPPGGAVELHQRLLEALEELEVGDPAVLTHHAVAARDGRRALAHARAAAAEAVRTASNVEAAAFLSIALDHLPSSAPPQERAVLLLQLSQQQYLTSRISDAIASARASIPLSDRAGRHELIAEAYGAMAVLEYHNGRRRYVEEHITRAMEIAEHAGDVHTLVKTQANAAFLAMIGSDLDAAVAGAERTIDLAGRAGLDEYVTAGEMTLELVGALCGTAGARSRALELADVARDHGWDELGSRSYDIVAFVDGDRGDLRGLQRVVDAGLTHAALRDLPVSRLWMISARATLHLLSGRWNAAVEDAESVVDGELLPGCLHNDLALALVHLRRGEAGAAVHRERVWATAQSLEEPLRMLPALAMLVEAMWLSGEPDPRVDHAVSGLPALLATPDTRWAGGNLLVWLRRAGLEVDVPIDVPEPFRSFLEGRHADAALWWQRAGNPYNEALAWADSEVEADRARAVGLLDRLGAAAVADKLRLALRQDGAAQVPKRPQASTRANPSGLTNRQLEVAQLVARGFSNAEIASRLFISPKTTEVHVSAVLAKLGVRNRRAVVLHAEELGLA